MDDGPKGLTGSIRTCRLDSDSALRSQSSLDQIIKGLAVELTELNVGWVGQIDDDDIIESRAALQKRQCISVDYLDAGIR